MDLKCKCPHCGTKIRYQVELSSGLAHCPDCKTQFQLPDAPKGIARMAGGASLEAILPTGGVRPMSSMSRGGLRLAFVDPMSSQPGAMNAMGKEAMLTWGFLLCVAFPVLGWLAFWRSETNVLAHVFKDGGLLGGMIEEGPRSSGSREVAEHIAVVAELTVFMVLLFGILLLLNALHGRKIPVRGILFTTGLVLLPFVGLSLYFVGRSFLDDMVKLTKETAEVLNHVTMFLTLLTLSSFFFLLLTSITSVIGFSRKAGFWLVPGVLMVTFVLFIWITKLTGEISKMGDKKNSFLRPQHSQTVLLRGER
ncbi:MAG: hypothetical protein GY872_02585 [Roseibacillus sp.]|nr:hypothetical protein [Roseibacillus sp.]HJM63171.1 hypothetical protein [Roseibacillus sp.]